MRLETITPMILTYNEIANIARVLDGVVWAQRIVVVDSGSTDGTLEALRANPRVEVFTRSFDSFAAQCNYGLTKILSEWVLSLDADYVCTDELRRELAELPDQPTASGFRASFRYCVGGQPLRGSLYPPRVVLYRHTDATYTNDGHAHHVVLPGAVSSLSSRILHDDRKPLDAWLRAQDRYSREEARKLKAAQPGELSTADRIRRRVWLAPLIMPFYCLFARGLVFDGMRGLHYALERTYAEVLLSLRLLAD